MAVDSAQEYRRLIGEEEPPNEKKNYVDASNTAFETLEKKIDPEHHKTSE